MPDPKAAIPSNIKLNVKRLNFILHRPFGGLDQRRWDTLAKMWQWPGCSTIFHEHGPAEHLPMAQIARVSALELRSANQIS
jgi:hypothetical protein